MSKHNRQKHVFKAISIKDAPPVNLSVDAKQKLDAYVQIEREHFLISGLMEWYVTAEMARKHEYVGSLVEHAQLLLDASKKLADLEKTK